MMITTFQVDNSKPALLLKELCCNIKALILELELVQVLSYVARIYNESELSIISMDYLQEACPPYKAIIP